MIKIFDSCTHPTLTNKWSFNKKIKSTNSSFVKLTSEIKKNNFIKACAIGFDNYEQYDHKKFINECNKYNNLIPIAGLDPKKDINTINNEIKFIKKLGFKGIKLHPRISKFNLDHKNLKRVIKIIEDNDLVLLLLN